MIQKKISLPIQKLTRLQYRQFSKATFLTSKAKYLIAQFLNQNKFNNISLERKESAEMRSFKLAVTTKWAAKCIKRITKASGAEWEPCSSTIHNIFKANGWHRWKSQKRLPFSDPGNKEEKIENFKRDLKDLILQGNLKPCNIHILDETGLYCDSIPPYTWKW